MSGRKKLGEILVDLHVLTNSQVERVLTALRRRRDQTKFGEMACSLGLLGEEHVLAALAVQLQLFPGIQDLGLKGILESLQGPAPQKATPARPARTKPSPTRR
jgi:hypothetical protein